MQSDNTQPKTEPMQDIPRKEADVKPKWNVVRHQDAQMFDEITITTIPRFKESYYSGSEWRFSAEATYWKKGIIVHRQRGSTVQWLAEHLLLESRSFVLTAETQRALDALCAQEGCMAPAVNTYRMKHQHCKCCASSEASDRFEAVNGGNRVNVRRFCARHSNRGDCGIDDSNANYELIDGPGVVRPNAADVSEPVLVLLQSQTCGDQEISSSSDDE